VTNGLLTARTSLIASPALTALVPATRILAAWPTTWNTLPIISINELNNYVDDYRDNLVASDVVEIEVQIFCEQNKSTADIASAVDNVLIPDGWNRDYSEMLFLEGQTLNRRVMRYSRRFEILPA
jgi:hypothetical protein